jgi:hypothetical protein
MKATWKELSFLPSNEALETLTKSWSWLLPKSFRPVTASALGDIFFQSEGDAVYWLNTGTADIEQVAASRADFLAALKTEKMNNWFMPHLVDQLLAAGKTLKTDYCYTYVTLPIFKEGTYEVSNLNPVPAKEHFAATGDVHRQIKDLPNRAKVKIAIT